MRKAILTRKVGMTQVFTEEGYVVPVTVLKSEGNVVLQVKTKENDGYSAYQLGFEDKREKVSTKSEIAHCKKAGTAPKRFVSEMRCKDISYKVGDTISVTNFNKGQIIDVTAKSKGKGFAGPVKLTNHHIGPKGHGSKYHRGSGSMGSIAANRVMKGKIMPSHMGAWTRTIQNLTIVDVLPELNVILVKGNVPGPRKALVFVKESLKKSA